jgi:hypothetical protein
MHASARHCLYHTMLFFAVEPERQLFTRRLWLTTTECGEANDRYHPVIRFSVNAAVTYYT